MYSVTIFCVTALQKNKIPAILTIGTVYVLWSDGSTVHKDTTLWLVRKHQKTTDVSDI